MAVARVTCCSLLFHPVSLSLSDSPRPDFRQTRNATPQHLQRSCFVHWFGLFANSCELVPPAMDSSSPVKRRVLGTLDPNAASPRTPQQLGTKQTMKMDPVASRSPSHPQIHSLPSPPRGDDGDLRKRPMQQQMAPHVLEDEDEQVEPSKKRPCLRDEPEEDVAASQEVCRSRHGPTTLSSKSNHVPVVQSPVSPLRHGSASPEASSVFDNSIIDTSHATAITEPDEQQQGGANPLYAAAAAAVAASAPIRRRAGSRLTREEAREVRSRTIHPRNNSLANTHTKYRKPKPSGYVSV